MENVNIHSLIRERFTQLPKQLQEAITSAEVAEKLREISQKHRLHLDQGQILENETYMVLLGVEKAEAYEDNIRKEASLSDEDARKIADEVGKEIFLAIREALKSLTAESAAQTQPSAPAALHIAPREPQSAPVPTQIAHSTPPTYPTPQPKADNKLEEVVKRPSQDIEIAPQNHYKGVDPYREPAE